MKGWGTATIECESGGLTQLKAIAWADGTFTCEIERRSREQQAAYMRAFDEIYEAAIAGRKPPEWVETADFGTVEKADFADAPSAFAYLGGTRAAAEAIWQANHLIWLQPQE